MVGIAWGLHLLNAVALSLEPVGSNPPVNALLTMLDEFAVRILSHHSQEYRRRFADVAFAGLLPVKVYFGSNDRKLYAVREDNGQLIWQLGKQLSKS